MNPTEAPRLDLKRRIVKNTSANALAQAATVLSTLVLFPLLVASFGVSAFGTLALSMAIVGYTSLLDLGISATLTRNVAERTARGDLRGTVRAVLASTMLYGLLGLVVAATLVGLGALAGSTFKLSPTEATLLKALLTISAGAVLLQWPMMAARDALAGLQRYDLIAATTLLIVAFDVAGTIYVLAAGQGPQVLLAIRVAGMVAASLANVAFLLKCLPAGDAQSAGLLNEARHIIRSGAPIFLLQIASVLSRQQADKLILGIFVGPASVTIYEIAAKLNSLVTMLTSLATSATLPVVAEITVAEDVAKLRDVFLRGTKIIAFLIAPISIVLIIMADPFIDLWVGSSFGDAALIAQLLIGSQLLLPLYQLGDQVLIGMDRFSAWVPGGLSLALLNVGLSIVLVERFGAAGVATATLIACLLEFPLYARVLGREIDLPFRTWLHETAWPTYPPLLIPLSVAGLAVSPWLPSSPVVLAAASLLSLVSYWAVTLRVGFTFAERSELKALLPSAMRGAP